jgi:hypothetical protein
VLLGRGLCNELIARPEESYRLCCVVVCDLETSRISAPYIYAISNLRVNWEPIQTDDTNSRFSQFCEGALKKNLSLSLPGNISVKFGTGANGSPTPF